jgi:predicted MFS family arabinose efflux permease
MTGGLRNAVGALRTPAYRWWFGSQILSASGSMTQAVAQSWLVLQLTGSAVDLGILAAVTWGPVLLGGAWAGAWVDRIDRRRLLLVTQSLFILLGLVQAALVATGVVQVWMVFLVAVATGCVAAFDGPARQVYVLELVGTQRVASAVSLYEVGLNASRVLGPALGGLVLATSGTTICFLVNAACYLPPLAVVARFTPDPGLAPPPRHRTPGAVREGLAYVWRVPAIRACVLVAATGGILFNLAVAVPLLATQAFHLGGGGYGALMAAFGVGAIPGALLSAAGSAWPTGPRVRVLTAASGAAVVGTAYAPDAVAGFVGMAAAGFLSIWLIALANTLVQLRAEPALRGRVMGAWTMALPGTLPFSSMLTAGVAQGFGARAGFAVAGFALLLTAALTWSALSDIGSPEGEPAPVPVRTG